MIKELHVKNYTTILKKKDLHIKSNKTANIANKYRELANKEDKVIFGGRLAEYKYYDMDDVIKSAMDIANKELN